MEDPAILKLNLERFRHLLLMETDSAKRQTLFKLIRETEANLRQPETIPQNDVADGGCVT